jgi:hypothetical protein
MAYIARYHRNALSPKQAKAIRSLILPSQPRSGARKPPLPGEQPDRSHTGVIKRPGSSPPAGSRPGSNCKPRMAATSNYGALLHKKDFERTFGRTLRISVHHTSASR